MRFIIHELPYERPRLAGQLRYERDGQPTGTVESWRLSDAADGYRFLRVDLDAREGESGRSWLYHVTLNPAGQPEQVRARFWEEGREVNLAAVRQDDEWLAARQVDGVAYQDVARGEAFWFPAGSGLALLRSSAGQTRGVTLLTDTSDPARLLALVQTPVSIVLGATTTETVGDETLPVQSLSVAWGQSRRTVWLDNDARPLRLWREDGLTAAAQRLVRYGG